MTKNDLSEALALARSDATLPGPEELGIFDGYALPDFQPIDCTLELLAALLRWEVVTFSGGIDHEALNELSRCGRHRFRVLRPAAVDAA
ncbi:MAG: hypothetical protein SYC29_02615 [Planctomycetota bacterium]|nr:hypothetical protein [Planctomycetota bacterium]